MYTKGEWKVETHGDAEDLYVRDTELYESVARIFHSSTYPYGKAIANAHLIAAAPDMYEALKEISEGKGRYSLDKLTHASNTIDDMKALAIEAIAKAEGSDG